MTPTRVVLALLVFHRGKPPMGGEWVWRETETGPALMLPGCVHVALLLEGAKATVPSTFHSSWRAQVH